MTQCKDRQIGYNLISGENNWLHLWEKTTHIDPYQTKKQFLRELIQ